MAATSTPLVAAGPEAGNSFWQKIRQYFRPARRLRFTREGRFFVGMIFGVGFAAINTGNNLLYIILGMMLSLIVVSGVLSELTLRGVRVARNVPPQIFAGRPFLMGVALRNTKGRLPSFSLEVEDILGDHPLDKKCYFLKVPAGKTQQTSYRFTFPKRGVYHFHGFTLATKYPFALFRKSRQIPAAAEAIVFPRVGEVAEFAAEELGFGAGLPSRKRARGDEFHALRQLRPGDDRRDIHWKITAKIGRTMVREYEGEAVRRVIIALDNRLPEGTEQEAISELIDEMESAVELAASLARHFLQRGYVVGITARRGSVAPGSGSGQLWRILRFLALIDFIAGDDAEAPPLSQAEPLAHNVLVTHRQSHSQGAATFSRVFRVGMG